jgi:hypothetical protein
MICHGFEGRDSHGQPGQVVPADSASLMSVDGKAHSGDDREDVAPY